jgi:hypothetical protein
VGKVGSPGYAQGQIHWGSNTLEDNVEGVGNILEDEEDSGEDE